MRRGSGSRASYTRLWVLATALLASHPGSSLAIGATQFQERPLVFEDNRGQAPVDTRFLARGRNYQIHLGSSAMAIALRPAAEPAYSQRLRVVRVRLVGANAHAKSIGEVLLPSKSNYFLDADASRPIIDVPNYARVRFDEVYPSIGIVYYGNQGQLEYDFLVQPGGDTRAVRLAINGADGIDMEANGDLRLSIGTTAVVLKRPVVYQEYDGERHPVEAWFERRGRNELAIRTGRYDHRYTLTIDPVLTYGSYLGGSNDCTANHLMRDCMVA